MPGRPVDAERRMQHAVAEQRSVDGRRAASAVTCPSGGGAAAPAPTVASDDFASDLASQTSRNFLFFSGADSTTAPTVSTNALTIRPYLNTNHVITNNLGVVPAATTSTRSAQGRRGPRSATSVRGTSTRSTTRSISTTASRSESSRPPARTRSRLGTLIVRAAPTSRCPSRWRSRISPRWSAARRRSIWRLRTRWARTARTW